MPQRRFIQGEPWGWRELNQRLGGDGVGLKEGRYLPKIVRV